MADTYFQGKERAAGLKAASALRVALRAKIKSKFNRRSGDMEKSTVTAKYKEGFLDRLVLDSPHYSFKQHFGSSLSGTTGETSRKQTTVNSFARHVNGETVTVKSHTRKATNVVAHIKGIDYKSKNHIAEAFKSTNALQQLANDLGENRIVNITSQIDFQ